MRRSLIALTLIVLVSLQVVHAQTRAISGRVLSKHDQQPIPGASIIVANTKLGTITDFDGYFQLHVPQDGDSLIVRFIGMKSLALAISDQKNYPIELEEDRVAVDEVVVTALGVSREKKALGYSVQNVSGDEVNKTSQSNMVSMLSGKVAGVQVSGSPSALGGSSRILIRGANSITGENQPLFVVDGVPIDNTSYSDSNTRPGGSGFDYGNMAQDINPDDIASVSVLKGPSAAALYGSRAANGVIMITTKKGSSKNKGLGIQVSSGVSIEKVNRLPRLQRDYGGGGLSNFDKIEINGKEYNAVAYHVDESWGPKFDPNTEVLHWDALNKNDAQNYLVTRPWVAPKNDIDKFFETGVTYNNSVSLSGADEKSQFRIALTGVNSDGFLPNSELDKYTVSFNGATQISDPLRISAGASYTNTRALGRPVTGYSSNNVMLQMTQWGQRQLDYERLRNYKNEDGTHNPWNRTSPTNARPKYINNPYWIRNENYTEDERNRLIGNVGLTYSPIEGMSASLKAYHDSYVFQNSERMAVGSRNTAYYSEGVRQSRENNYEFTLNVDRALSPDLHFQSLLGGNIRKNHFYQSYSSTQNGLFIPNLYTTENSVDPQLVKDYERHRLGYSLFGSINLGYKNTFYLDATFRNDWSSTLPKSNRSYFYPSLNASVVLSELPALKEFSWISFLKLRGGWAKVGNDTDPYVLEETYVSNPPNFKGIAKYSVPDILANSKLKSETTYSTELGMEGAFFKGRLGFDLTLYSNRTKDLITNVALSGATGYTHMIDNAGEMTNKGIEWMIQATPIKTKDLSWNVSVNFAKNVNKLVQLKEGINNYQMGVAPQNVTINAFVGSSYGAIMGSNFVYDQDGNKVVGTDGRYLESATPEIIGHMLPDYNMGISNTIEYKNISLSALIDIQKGGQYYSISNLFGMSSGILEETVYQNGVDIRQQGVTLDAVYGRLNNQGVVEYLNQEGDVSTVPVKNSTSISARRYGKDFRYGPDAQNIFDASYIKLREVTLSYRFPNRMTGWFQNVTLSLYGRNLYAWGLDNPNIDPEQTVTSASNVQGVEGGALPSTANYGVNIKFNL